VIVGEGVDKKPKWNHYGSMYSLTVKSLPEELHQNLKKRAKLHNRSLNREVISILQEATAPSRKIDAKALVEDARRFVAAQKFSIPHDQVDALKREGREEF